MQPISSSDFRNNNQILSTAKLGKMCFGKLPHKTENAVDVIDLNGDGLCSVTKFKTTIYTKEPVLEPNFSKFETFAKRYNAEVVTQDDIKNVYVGQAVGGYEKPDFEKKNLRPISTLIPEMEPFEKNAKWAIDVKTEEFLIYKPKQ